MRNRGRTGCGVFGGVLLLAALTTAAPAELHAATQAGEDQSAAEHGADRRLYFAMWTLHFRELERGLDNNWALGLTWRGLYGATFINSFGNRAFSGGVQRTFGRWTAGGASLEAGYRAGLITGYDERFIPLAGRTPVVPVVQPLLAAGRGRAGVELSYSGVIASAALSVRF